MSKNDRTALVPRLRFPEFIGEEAWSTVKIKQHLKESKIKGSSGNVAKKLTVKLWGKGVSEKKEVLQGSENTQYYRRKAGQFIYSKLDFLNQAFGIVPNHLDNYESTVDLPCFDVDREIDVKFLLEYVQRKTFYKRFGEIADGGRKAKRIQVETFLEFPISLPKLPEQRKIANCLTSFDDLVAAESKKLEVLKMHKKGLMQKLFPSEGKTVPVIRFEGYTDTWKQQKLGEMYKTYSGQTPLRSDASNFENATTPWIKTTDLNNGEIRYNDEDISDKGARALKILPADTVLIAMYGGFNQIGRTGLLTYPSTINQALTALEPNGKVNAYFLITQLNHRVDEWKTVAASSRKDANITKKDVEDFNLRYPSLPEQTTIGKFFRNLDELIAAQAKKIETLKLHKKGLMQGLFPSAHEVIG